MTDYEHWKDVIAEVKVEIAAALSGSGLTKLEGKLKVDDLLFF